MTWKKLLMVSDFYSFWKVNVGISVEKYLIIARMKWFIHSVTVSEDLSLWRLLSPLKIFKLRYIKFRGKFSIIFSLYYIGNCLIITITFKKILFHFFVYRKIGHKNHVNILTSAANGLTIWFVAFLLLNRSQMLVSSVMHQRL